MTHSLLTSTAHDSPRALLERFRDVRAATVGLCAPLETEDFVVSQHARRQSHEVAPRAHELVLRDVRARAALDATTSRSNPKYAFLFNSYYVQAGERHCRAQRGLVTRPTVAEVFAYRAHVDDAMTALCAQHRRRSRASGRSGDRARAASRAAASGAAAHRHQARLLDEPDASGVPHPCRRATPRALGAGLGTRRRRGVIASGTRATGSPSTMSRPSHRVLSCDAFRDSHIVS